MADSSAASTSAQLLSASPCVGICQLGADGRCTGCRRSREELAGWAAFTAERRDAINRANLPTAAAAVRTKLLGAAAATPAVEE